MGWFSKAIDAGVKRGIESAIERASRPGGLLEQAVDRVLGTNLPDDAPMTETQFIWAMAQHLRWRGAKASFALPLASGALRQLLKDERIDYGAHSYLWDRNAARIAADEYEADHWETVDA
jgi:hypothetical protein